MSQEMAEIPTTRRRTVLKAIGAGTTGVAFLSTNTTAQSSSIGEVVFEDEFEDGQLDWTDVDHPEFWSEQGGQVQYSPSTSAGSTGDNYLYADETFDGDEGLLEWPVVLEFRGYASDTSAGLGAFATGGGPKDGRGDVRLGIQDGKYNDQFHVWNSEGEQFTLSGARENNTWYTYRLVPDLENNEIQISRNNESWTVPEPNDDPIGNTSIALSGGTCWGCGGNGDRKYEYITVTEGKSQTGEEAPFKVISVNKGSMGRFAFHSENGINSLRIRPATSLEDRTIKGVIDSTLDRKEVTFNRTENGVYRASNIDVMNFTQFVSLTLQSLGGTRQVPMVYDRDPLEAPLLDWISWPSSATRVKVEDTDYYAIALDDRETYNDSPTKNAWLTFDTDRTLIEDAEKRQNIGLSATVSLGSEWFFHPKSLDEWAKNLIKIRDLANTADTILQIQEIAASLLDDFIVLAITKGANAPKETIIKEFVTEFAKEFAEDYVKNYLKKQLAEDIELIEAAEISLKEWANDQLTESAQQARIVSQRMSQHNITDPWIYSDAKEIWNMVTESVVQGSFAMALRTNLLPNADLRSQFKRVADTAAEDAVGVSIDMLINWNKDGELGYISKATQETAYVRREIREITKSYGEYSDNVHQEALSQYKGGEIFNPNKGNVI